MNEIVLQSLNEKGLDREQIEDALRASIEELKGTLSKVLLIPPDFTRMYSGAGEITAVYYRLLKSQNSNCIVDILPALGTHRPMSREEALAFFGKDLPYECIIPHNWRNDVVKIGEVPADYIKEISEGLMDTPIDVEINRRLLDKSYDLILSIGQVVPHEVVGMANYSKNIFVGCGGSNMINQTHMLGAFYGMERIMGKDHSPVRKVFDYAEARFIADLPLQYVLTITTQCGDFAAIHGLFIGRNRALFEQAVTLSQQKNLTHVEKPFEKVVVYLDEREFKSTWLGNKAIYRTRMAIKDGGELIVLAPGIEKFGEDDENDRLIRKYGYIGRLKVLELCKSPACEDLRDNLSVAAHLIHGSSDGRFTITYAAGHLSRKEVTGAGFNYIDPRLALSKYNPACLHDGYNTLDNGEEIFYISNPALGLWIAD